MAIKSVTRVFNERLVWDVSGIKVYQNYRVEFDALAGADSNACLDAVDPVTSLKIPGYGATISATVNSLTYPCYLASFEPQQQTGLVYIVLCTFDSAFATSIFNTAGNTEVSFSVRGVKVIQDVSRDKDGNPIINDAGEPYKGVKQTFHDEEITITWKTKTPPIDTIESLLDSVNASDCQFIIKGITRRFPATTLRFDDFDYGVVTGDSLWSVSVKMVYRIDTWVTDLVDEGTYYLDDAGNHVEAPTGGNVLLNEDGGQLSDGEDPVAVQYYLDDQNDFASLFAGLSDE